MMGGCAGPSDRSLPAAVPGSRLIVALAPAAAGGRPNDPVFEQGLQWGLERIGAPGAWAQGTGEGITIAVVDSGVDLGHEDLAPKLDGHVSCIGASGQPERVPRVRAGRQRPRHPRGRHRRRPPRATAGARRRGARRPAAGGAGAGQNSCSGGGVHGHRLRRRRRRGDPLGRRPRRRRHQPQPRRRRRSRASLGCAFCDAVEYAWSKGAIAVVAAGNDSVAPGGVLRRARGGRHRDHPCRHPRVLQQRQLRAAARGAVAGGGARRRGGDRSGRLRHRWHAEGHPLDLLGGGAAATRTRAWPARRWRRPHVAGALAVLRSTGLAPAGGGRPAARHRPGPRPAAAATTSSASAGSTSAGRWAPRRGAPPRPRPPPAPPPRASPSRAAAPRPPPRRARRPHRATGELPEVAAPAPFAPDAAARGDDRPPGWSALAIPPSSPAAAPRRGAVARWRAGRRATGPARPTVARPPPAP